MPYVLLQKPNAAKDPVVTPATHVKEVTRNGKMFLDKDDNRVVSMNPDTGVIEDRDPGTSGWWEETVKTPKGNYSFHGGKHIIMAV